MGVPIADYDAFVEHYSRSRDNVDLFAFLLYSTRSSHKVVASFAGARKGFLDELAVNQQMYLYFFVLNRFNALRNPAATVTATFGVPLSQLPGILIFDNLDMTTKKDCSFLST